MTELVQSVQTTASPRRLDGHRGRRAPRRAPDREVVVKRLHRFLGYVVMALLLVLGALLGLICGALLSGCSHDEYPGCQTDVVLTPAPGECFLIWDEKGLGACDVHLYGQICTVLMPGDSLALADAGDATLAAGSVKRDGRCSLECAR